MNQYKKRINDLKQRKDRRLKTPVVIANITEHEEYVYKGNVYNEEQFRELMKKVNPDVIILDDTKMADISRQ